ALRERRLRRLHHPPHDHPLQRQRVRRAHQPLQDLVHGGRSGRIGRAAAAAAGRPSGGGSAGGSGCEGRAGAAVRGGRERLVCPSAFTSSPTGPLAALTRIPRCGEAMAGPVPPLSLRAQPVLSSWDWCLLLCLSLLPASKCTCN
uniref:Uncharacterized protein n=1 Tax=Otus sunia TaxID=257818 RepID=A0A8C8BQU6_9STRI